MPKPFPKEFRDDVIHVQESVIRRSRSRRSRRTSVSMSELSISGCVRRGSRPASRARRSRSPRSTHVSCGSAIVSSSRKSRSCVARPRPVPGSICRENDVPTGCRARRRRHSRRGVVPGIEARSPALLPLAGAPFTRRELDEAYRANALLDAACATTRSSGIDYASPTRPAMKAARRCRIERPGEFMRTAGGACSGRARQERQEGLAPPFADDLYVVMDGPAVSVTGSWRPGRTSSG